mgnify:CR=1 FL=1
MLSTVVLPAPLGPIRLVTRPGSAAERHVGGSLARRRSAMREALHLQRRGGRRRRANAAMSKPDARGGARRGAAPEAARACRRSLPARATAPPAAARRTAAGGTRRARRAAPGSTTMTAAPTSGPSTQPAPPTMTASRNRIDCENGKELGADEGRSAARTAPPASPVNAADSAKATVLTMTRVEADRPRRGLAVAHGAPWPCPAARAPAGGTRRATRRRARREQRQQPALALEAAAAGPAAAMSDEAVLAAGQPPRHSIVTCSTMKPKAMVTMAR